MAKFSPTVPLEVAPAVVPLPGSSGTSAVLPPGAVLLGYDSTAPGRSGTTAAPAVLPPDERKIAETRN